VHLLALDRGQDEISRGMQLIAGRTGQAYNRRKRRRGAFWEDRYQATAVDTEVHLARCLTYIDLNMVRAAVVGHPREWKEAGYDEIRNPSKRYRIIDRTALCELLGVEEGRLATVLDEWLEAELVRDDSTRKAYWSEAVAVGRRQFVEGVRERLGVRALYREIDEVDGVSVLREGEEAYSPDTGGKMRALIRDWTPDPAPT